jgi:hypothetical protein
VLVDSIDGQPRSVAFQKVVDAWVAVAFTPEHNQSRFKRALLENGVEVTVPLSVEAGDKIRLYVDLLRAI